MDYRKIYNQICEKSKSETLIRKQNKDLGLGYYEGHHIIPKCMGGEGDSKDWSHTNITPLTPREHFLCHWLLHEIYPNNRKLLYSFNMMCNCVNVNNRYTPSSRIYEYIIKKRKELGHSKETRKKIGLSRIGISAWNKDKTGCYSDSTIKKLSESKLGKTWEEIYGENNSKILKKERSINYSGKGNPMFGQGEKLNGEKNGRYGTTIITNGIINKTIKINDIIPEGFWRGSKKYNRKQSEKKMWINNGIINKKIEVNKDLPIGFSKGKLNNR